MLQWLEYLVLVPALMMQLAVFGGINHDLKNIKLDNNEKETGRWSVSFFG